MANIYHRRPYRVTGRAALAAAGAALAIALATVSFILRYYAFYHFGVGPGFAVLGIGLPAGAVLLFFLLVGTLVVCQRRRVAPRSAMTTAALVGLGVACAVSGFEVWRTTPDRRGEGPGAGDLAPFFASLIGRR